MDLMIEKKNRQMKIESYDNAVILPRLQKGDYPMWGLGGVCTAQGEFVDLSLYDGGWATHGGRYEWDKSQEIYMDETIVYFGMFYKHWGHFLVDLIGRMWYPVCSKEYHKKMKVAYLGEEEPDNNHLEFFRLLGIEEEQLIRVDGPIRCKKLIVPEFAAKSCEWYSDEYVKMFDGIIEQVNSDQLLNDKYGNLESVYFTRTQFKKAQESEFGEKYIEKVYAENGYNILAPEKLTLREQIFLWNHAKRIACVNGTIPLNVAFTQNEKLDLLVLNKTSIFHGNPYLYLQMRGVKCTFLDVYREPIKGYPKSLGEGPFMLEINEGLLEWFDDRGMMVNYTQLDLWNQKVKNYVSYVWCIIGMKRRVKMFLSRIIPQEAKNIIRRVLHKG